ncbi:MAG: TPM domain-containing protein [Clostridia bacterium]|nr:TPM domain-containing protein [Clostridia bacterium]
MKKRIISVILSLVVAFGSAAAVFASNGEYIYDPNNMISSRSSTEIDETAQLISENYGISAYFALDESRTDSDILEWAKQLHEEHALESDSIMLTIDDDEYCFYRTGKAEEIFTQQDRNVMWSAYRDSKTYADGAKAYYEKLDGILSERLGGNETPEASSQPEPVSQQDPAVAVPNGGSVALAVRRLNDDASLLDSYERSSLLAKLDEISERQEMDIVIVTTDSTGDKTPTEYADDYYDYNGFGFGEDKDGILLLLSMDERDWAISTTGEAIQVFTDADQQDIVDRILPDLSGGDYYAAFDQFADICDEHITESKNALSYDPKDVTTIFPELSRVNDGASLLSEGDRLKLLAKLNEISERQKMDIVIVTMDSISPRTPTEFADDFYDYNGFGFGENKDGILLLLSMAERDWAISTTGAGIPYFTDAGQKYITDKIVPHLSDGDYYKAFDRFGDLCDQFITEAKKGTPYDVGHMPLTLPGFLGTALAIGLGVFLTYIILESIKGNLNTVSPKKEAGQYVVGGSMHIDDGREVFLRTSMTRTLIPTSDSSSRGGGGGGGSSTHFGSSGTSHGGSSGKF